ncbi:MAG: PGPGW domain-containing protein [Halioglobus sp.]
MLDSIDWQQLFIWSATVSLIAVVATVFAVPWVITRLPHDYFSETRRSAWREASDEPVTAQILTLVKNGVGAVLLLLGLLMLVTPGQGVLTLLAGLLMMNFPGKYRLERWLVMRPGVLKGLNWLRQIKGKPPFDTPPERQNADED